MLNFNPQVLSVLRRDEELFSENWQNNKIKLATSFSGIMWHYILMIVKTPRDLHNGLMRRFCRKPSSIIENRSYLSVLSQVLSYYFAKSTRISRLIHFLGNVNSRKIFIVDEFFSIKMVNLNKIKNMGTIIYVSADLAYDFFGDNLIASGLMRKIEQDAIALTDLVIACSERDKIKYLEMGAKNVMYYPNIYPIPEFEPCNKDRSLSITIVMRDYWGSRAYNSLKEVFKALTLLDKPIKLSLIGIKPENIPKNVELHHYDFIPSKSNYLTVLSKSWIGINLGVHEGGTNQRKYDYSMAGLVVLSDTLGSRGDLLPHELSLIHI